MHVWQLTRRKLGIGPRPLVMGIVNVPPDSFSDGGGHASTDAAIQHALELVEQGADIIDIGGESTRPGAQPVPVAEELARVVPVVRGLANRTQAALSVDTSKAEVARQCLREGAEIINDVTALGGDPEMAEVAVHFEAGVVLMHMQGTPATMQIDPHYVDVVAEIAHFFEERLEASRRAGIDRARVVLDPGIGFGKTEAHNLTLLARLEEFQKWGRPVCLGVSRKGFIGKLLGKKVEGRLAGSLAATCFALSRQAVQIVRAHDVRDTWDAVTLFTTIANCRETKEIRG